MNPLFTSWPKSAPRVILLCVALLLLSTCDNRENDPTPFGDFIISVENPVVGERVYFSAQINGANSFRWSSASAGFYSENENSTFVFSNAGLFLITLKATGPGGTITLSKQLTVKDPDDSFRIATLDKSAISFVNKYKVPGLSVVISKDGKLVYGKGYGDANEKAHDKATPAHLFRIASVSKVITAVAMMKLIEDGRLAIDDKVFGSGAILGVQYGTQPYKKYVEEITVRHLLNHTEGGWGNEKNDPMFIWSTLDYNHAELITHVLDNIPLDSKPGTSYHYSNFGYSVLGRVIEKISGKSYETFVKEIILNPIGITDAFIAGNTLADRKAGEVVYYAQGTDLEVGPYSKAVSASRLDACAGWIIAPKDMVRLLLSVDGFSSRPDILKPSTLTLMTDASPVNPWYASGCQVNGSGDWWHSGSLVGTATLAINSKSGFCIAVFANTRSLEKDFAADMEKLAWSLIRDKSIEWREIDLTF